MAKEETNISNRVRLKLSRLCRTFRNNVGLFTTISGDKIRTGLCKGSSDLIGWTTVEVTPDMVGKKVAIFMGIEIKSSKGRMSKAQIKFAENVNDAGGIAFMARSPEEAEEKLTSRIKDLQNARSNR
jgi:hypothetical protein